MFVGCVFFSDSRLVLKLGWWSVDRLVFVGFEGMNNRLKVGTVV